MIGLKTFAVATAIALMGPTLAYSEGLDDLSGYIWAEAPFANCPGQEYPPECKALGTRWDQGKKQFIDFGYRYYPENRNLAIGLSMYNDDHLDGDTVCFVTLWQGDDGQPIDAFFQRWGVKAVPNKNGYRRTSHFVHILPEGAASKITTVRMGWKQCGKIDDEAIARAVIDVAAVGCGFYTGQPEACKAVAEAAKAELTGEAPIGVD